MSDLSEIGGFDAAAVEPNAGFEVIPAGEYRVVIVESAMKPTSNGAGKYLELKLQIVSGEYQNRNLWDRLNLINQSQKAVEIARGTLSAICRAVNVLTPKDSSELHNKPLVARVKVEKRDDTGELTNKVASYKPCNGSTPVAAATPSARPW